MWKGSMDSMYGKQRSGGDIVLLGRARVGQIRDDHQGLKVQLSATLFYILGPRVIDCDSMGSKL